MTSILTTSPYQSIQSSRLAAAKQKAIEEKLASLGLTASTFRATDNDETKEQLVTSNHPISSEVEEQFHLQRVSESEEIQRYFRVFDPEMADQAEESPTLEKPEAVIAATGCESKACACGAKTRKMSIRFEENAKEHL